VCGQKTKGEWLVQRILSLQKLSQNAAPQIAVAVASATSSTSYCCNSKGQNAGL